MFDRSAVTPITHAGSGPHAPALTPSELHAARRCESLIPVPPSAFASVEEWGGADLGEGLL